MSETVNRRNAILAAGALAATAGVAAAQKIQYATEKPAEDVQPPFDDKATQLPSGPAHLLKLRIHLTDGQTLDVSALHVDITFIDDTCLAVSQSGAKPVAAPMRAETLKQ